MSEAIPYILVGIVLYALYNYILPTNINWNKKERKWRIISTLIEISIPFVVCAFLFTHTEKALFIAVAASASLYCLSEYIIKSKAYKQRMKYIHKKETIIEMISAYEKCKNPKERNDIKRKITSLKNELKHA